MMKNFSTSSFIAGVIVGLVLAGVWLVGNDPSLMPLPNQQTLSATVATSSTPSSDAVAVSDQQAGSSVLIDSVTVPPPGVWVAVRETDGSDLGNVLGAVRVAGPHTQITVPLLRATEADTTYAVELYRDDNNGAFDPGVNSVYVDFDSGERVVVYFKTTN